MGSVDSLFYKDRIQKNKSEDIYKTEDLYTF